MDMLSDEVMWLTKVTYQALDWLATLFVFFVGLLIYVWKIKKSHVTHMEAMPLADDEPQNQLNL